MAKYTSDYLLACAWRDGKQPEGEHKWLSISFRGASYYSYGTVIARKLIHRGQDGFVVDRAKFSNTTSRHQGNVWHVLNESYKRFPVEIGRMGQDLDFTPQTLRDHYIDLFRDKYVPKGSRQVTVARKLLERMRNLDQAIRVCHRFRIAGAPRLTRLHGKHWHQVGLAESIIEEASARAQAAADTRRERQEARYAAEHAAAVSRAIQGAEEALRRVPASWSPIPDDLLLEVFGSENNLLNSRPDLKAGIFALQLRRAEKKNQERVSEMWREKYDLEQKLAELEEKQAAEAQAKRDSLRVRYDYIRVVSLDEPNQEPQGSAETETED